MCMSRGKKVPGKGDKDKGPEAEAHWCVCGTVRRPKWLEDSEEGGY